MMPFVPITAELLKPDFVAQQYPVLATALDRENDQCAQEWLGLIYLDQAIVDPQPAWDNVEGLRIFDGGNSRTNSMYWIATRPRNSVQMAPRPQKHSEAGAACQGHAVCFARGLGGQCCPTDQGVMLECCDQCCSSCSTCGCSSRCAQLFAAAATATAASTLSNLLQFGEDAVLC
eukprot:17115-Heterococcus_DN1.PRE.2